MVVATLAVAMLKCAECFMTCHGPRIGPGFPSLECARIYPSE